MRENVDIISTSDKSEPRQITEIGCLERHEDIYCYLVLNPIDTSSFVIITTQ
jgi:hypothetical protein